MKEKKVYVIIPVYNTEKYIKKCIDSVICQSYRNIHVICVDDGSTDASPSILDNYSSLYSNVKVIHQYNKGLSGARNTALRLLDDDMSDSYITFVDSDDWVDKDYIATLVSFLEQYDVDIVCSSFYFSDEKMNRLYQNNIECDVAMDALEATRLLLFDETIQSHAPTKLFKSELLKGVLFDTNLSYMEDQSFTFKIFYRANDIYISNYCGYYYRQNNSESLTKMALNNKKIIASLRSYYSPCVYQYKERDRATLIPSADHGLVTAFLMVIPYFKKKEATNSDILFIKEIKSYLKSKNLIKQYRSSINNNMRKRKLYLLCPFAYQLTFKIAKYVSRHIK